MIRRVSAMLALSIAAIGQTIQWTRQFGTVGADDAQGVAVDVTGVYVAGCSEGFLPGQTSMGRFLRKYDSNGNELWTRQFSPGVFCTGVRVRVAVDSTGVYVVGGTYLALPGQTAFGGGDVFVRKYDANGTELWTRQFGSPDYDDPTGVAVDATGVYVVGRTRGTLPGQTSAGNYDAFVHKYDANGNELWTRQFGSTALDDAWGVTVDATGVYVVGDTNGTLPGQTRSGADFTYADAFVRKYDANGTELWTRQFGSAHLLYVTEGCSASGAAVDATGVYVVGNIAGALPGQTSSGPYSDDVFVRKYDVGGKELWTRQFGSPSYDDPAAVAADATGVYVVGFTLGTLPGQTKAGEEDAFVRKYDASGAEQWTLQFGPSRSTLHARALGAAVDATGVYVAGYTDGTLAGQTRDPYFEFDAFLMKLYDLSAVAPSISLSNTQLQFWYYLNGGAPPPAQTIGVSNSGGGTLSWSATANVPWVALSAALDGFTVAVNPIGLDPGGYPAIISVMAPGADNNPQTVAVTLMVNPSVQVSPPSATRFIPITPCRIADTRNAFGPLGGPALPGQTARDFSIPSSACGISAYAVAYSLNVAVVPSGPLGYLTLWPSGQPQPLVATLNSDGRIKSNAAIIPAGMNGTITTFVTDPTDVILDINGYFVPTTNATALAFYPLTPCRVADTRNPTGPLGGPSLAAQSTRSFPILASSCGPPANAQAYSLNFAAVPKGPTLGYMTAWPAGQPQPLVSSLNDPTGTVLANAVVVPAGVGGAVNVYTTDATDLVIDINGYFAPQGPGGLSLYTVSPCRVLDSRGPTGTGTPPFSTTQDVNVTASPCGVPATAQAFVFNATVVPPGPLGYITMWPQGQKQPLAATLNAYDGAITNNMAIVPTTTGSVSVFPSAATHLVLDVFGYFAP